MRLSHVILAVMMLAIPLCAGAQDGAITIGSKKFTESVILADLAADLARASGARVIERPELGGTRLLWDALLAGSIDLYPEYTGTITHEILSGEHITDDKSLAAALARHGLRMSRSLGFGDTYALGMMPQTAARLGVGKISDLASLPVVRFGLSNEFLDRGDGWPALRAAYGLSTGTPTGLDHDLAYRALASGSIDVIDLYTTDAEIAAYGVRVLDDDRHFFPAYDAVILYRADLAQRHPRALAAILRLEGQIDTSQMIAMNAAVRLHGQSEAQVAAQFVDQRLGLTTQVQSDDLATRIARRTIEHLTLTAISLAAAILFAIPLGIIAGRRARLGRLILSVVGVFQTIPALALLVFMIPVLGIGAPPAIAALFLYSMLPIVRNTASGLQAIPLPLRQSAIALGLSSWRRLVRIDLPMAMPAIFAGIKTAAVINIGTATLGALVGAGGYGQPILTGIRLDDTGLILEGAIPAAVLALTVEALFEGLERLMIPRGLRLRTPSAHRS